jgi:hypothetical protein
MIEHRLAESNACSILRKGGLLSALGRRQENELVSYSSAVSIDRPAAQIFPYLLETTKVPVWSDAPAKLVTQGDLSNGARLEVSFGMGPLKAVIGLRISAMVFGKKLAFESYSGPISWTGEYNLVDDGKGATTVSQKGQLKFKGLWRLVQPIAGGRIRRSEVWELQRLKRFIEATPAVPGAAA